MNQNNLNINESQSVDLYEGNSMNISNNVKIKLFQVEHKKSKGKLNMNVEQNKMNDLLMEDEK